MIKNLLIYNCLWRAYRRSKVTAFPRNLQRRERCFFSGGAREAAVNGSGCEEERYLEVGGI